MRTHTHTHARTHAHDTHTHMHTQTDTQTHTHTQTELHREAGAAGDHAHRKLLGLRQVSVESSCILGLRVRGVSIWRLAGFGVFGLTMGASILFAALQADLSVQHVKLEPTCSRRARKGLFSSNQGLVRLAIQARARIETLPLVEHLFSSSFFRSLMRCRLS